ncbi:PAS domain S-box protein [Desulfosarcina sp. OttesenSCG-928-B08]|nr:PAS domain S-box protein [Desulfosarcina sp. OttesenSCG-928-B08]
MNKNPSFNRLKRIFSKFLPCRQSALNRALSELEQTNRKLLDQEDQTRKMSLALDTANQMLEEQRDRLFDAERRYRYLFETGSDILCIHDLKGVILETNLHFKPEYGWHPGDLVGTAIRDLLSVPYQPEFDAYLARILENGADDGYLRLLLPSGETLVMEYRNRLILDENGKPVGAHGAARDVTQRVLAEKKLKESRERYRELLKCAPAGILDVDLIAWRIVRANDIMCDYTGHTETELLAMERPLDLLDAASQSAIVSLLMAVRQDQRETATLELTFDRKDGQPLFVIINFRFFYDGTQPKRVLVVVHDMTPVKQAEQEKKALEDRLASAQRLESLGTLAGSVAHDLNNILSGIVSYPDLLLLDLAEDHPLRQPLLTIKKSGERASEIVQDLLTLARRNVGLKKVAHLNDIVREFVDSPEYRKILEDRPHIEVITHLPEETLSILGSAPHISKTLMNLVANAVDAMPSGGRIRISTRDQRVDTPIMGFEQIPAGEYAVLEVSDNGIGIPAEDIDKIFEPFYTKKLMGRSGSGLGMSVVLGTLKDHGGYLDICTQEGVGTTFTLYFSGSRVHESADASVYIDDYLGNGESILIIDNMADQRLMARRMMERLGYDVHTAATGEEALAMIAEKRFDILLLDLALPGDISGLETLRMILEKVPDQRAIIVSNHADANMEDTREARRLGAGVCIKKPYSLERIGMAVRAELDR